MTGRTLSAASASPTPKPAPRPPQRRRAAQLPPRAQNLQDQFLNLLRKNKTPVTMFLVKGVKLQGIVTWFDNFSILLRRDGQSQLVYKHAISTIMPSQPVDARAVRRRGDGGKKQRLLQDVFLSQRAQRRGAGDDVPGQRRDAAGPRRRLRPVLHAARARRLRAARLQARGLDHPAGRRRST